VIAYASRTGTRRNLAALHGAGWRQLVTPVYPRVSRPARGFALDNGAWAAHQRGGRLDVHRFAEMLYALGRHADFVVAPDIVAGGRESLAVSIHWLPTCLYNARRVLIAVQDGMEPQDFDGVPLGPRVGLFVGGSTDWKLSTLPAWGRLARRRGAWLHVGRVNTARRIQLCRDAGADSFDGTSVTRFADTLPLLDGARRQVGVLPALWRAMGAA